MNKQPINKVFKNNSMEVALESLGNSIARWTDKGEQHVTAIPGLSLFRRAEPTEPISVMYEPSICLVAQGLRTQWGQPLTFDKLGCRERAC